MGDGGAPQTSAARMNTSAHMGSEERRGRMVQIYQPTFAKHCPFFQSIREGEHCGQMNGALPIAAGRAQWALSYTVKAAGR